MNTVIRTLSDKRRLEYLTFDRAFRIIQYSEGIAAFAESSHSVVAGADVRFAFPELVGSENEFAQILREENREWSLRNLSRSREGTRFLYVDMSVRSYATEQFVLVAEDVTDRAVTEQQLVQSSNEYRLLLQSVTSARDMLERVIASIGDALFFLSPAGVIRSVNPAASQLFGYHEAELVGRNIGEILSSPDLGNFEKSILHVEVEARVRSGEQLPLSVAVSIVRGFESKPEYVIVLARDLRVQKNAEQQIAKLRSEKQFLSARPDPTVNHFHGIVGCSKAMQDVFRQIEQVAPTDSTVLLLGETGTGKELVARAIHAMSSRCENLLVKVNCAAFQSSVVESELFGHEKGAFTGAITRRAGRFEFASGGTILLDEIGDLHLETQAKILRIIQEREFERVGGNVPVSVDVRIVAATNRDLASEVEAGKFRSDLFFRINVFPIHLPPLRERREDIPLLTQHFLDQFGERSNKRVEFVSPKAMNILQSYSWPGNVRELSAVLERAVIIATGNVLEESSFSFLKKQKASKADSRSLANAERDHILTVLKESGGVIEGPSGAAVKLDMKPSTLRSKMKKLGIHLPNKRFG